MDRCSTHMHASSLSPSARTWPRLPCTSKASARPPVAQLQPSLTLLAGARVLGRRGSRARAGGAGGPEGGGGADKAAAVLPATTVKDTPLEGHAEASDDEGLPPAFAEAETAQAEAGPGGGSSSLVAAVSFFGGIALLFGIGYGLRDQIKVFLDLFISLVDEWGPIGYLAYAVVYTGLEVLAVPAIPLTMTAGIVFGPIPGTIITSISGTIAATIAFLIARYGARDRIMKFAKGNKRFAAIDRAIARDGFKMVTLLRLSPLLPLAASNYLYGLTSLSLGQYVLGSWLGMLPGTYIYVSAGHVGKAVLMEGEGPGLGFEPWQVALGLGVTLLAIGYVGQLAKKAIEEVEADVGGSSEGNGSGR